MIKFYVLCQVLVTFKLKNKHKQTYKCNAHAQLSIHPFPVVKMAEVSVAIKLILLNYFILFY